MLLKDRFGRERFCPRSTSSRLALHAISSALMDATIGGGGGSATVAISAVTDGRLVAPTGVWFEATFPTNPSGFDVAENLPSFTNVYDPSFHKIHYLWTVTQAGRTVSYATPTHTTPGGSTIALNIPDIWNNRNVAYGKKVCLVFDQPGPVTVDLMAIDSSGNVGTAQWTGTIQNPDAIYTGANTICINPAGDANFSWAPAGAQTFNADASGLTNAFNAYEARPGDARMLWKRGGTYTMIDLDTNASRSMVIHPGLQDNCSNIYMDAGGTGAAPILDFGATGVQFINVQPNRGRYTQFTVANLEMKGGYNEEAQTGGLTPAMDFQRGASHYLFHKCKIQGFEGGMVVFTDDSFHQASGAGVVGPVIVSECVITNNRGYSVYSNDAKNPSMRFACIGTDISRSPLAVDGEVGNQASTNSTGNIRLSYYSNVYITCSSFMSKCGWSGGIPGGIAHQPCLRMQTSIRYAGTPGSAGVRGYPFINIERSTFEGGGAIVGLATTASGEDETLGSEEIGYNTVMDKILTLGSSFTATHIGPIAGGTTIRNWIGVQPNSGVFDNTFRRFASYSTNPDPTNALPNTRIPVALHNATFVNLKDASANNSGAAIIDVENVARFQTFTVENNIFHNPATGYGATPDTPMIGTTLAGFTPRFRGSVPTAGNRVAAGETAANTTVLWEPDPASPAYNSGGAGLRAHDDFKRQNRGQIAHKPRGAAVP